MPVNNYLLNLLLNCSYRKKTKLKNKIDFLFSQELHAQQLVKNSSILKEFIKRDS